MPGFFDFDMPMPPFPAFPELRVPQPVFSEPPPVFLVSEPLSMFDSVFTQQPGGLAKGMEEPFFFLDPQGGNPFRRQRHYRRSDPSGVHDHASYSSQPPSGQTSRQSSRSSTRHNSDAPHPIWVEEKTIKHTVNGKEQRYTMQKDVEGNVYETIEVPGESKRYIVNHVTILPTSEGVRIPGEQPHDSRRHEKSREKARTRESSRVRDHDHDHKHPDASRRSSDGLRHPSSKYPAAPPPPLPRNPFQQPPTAGPGIPTFYPPAQPYPPAHPIVPPQAPQPPPQSHPMIPNPYGKLFRWLHTYR
ncbi:uncharacterized protein EI90DRAFT_3075845 [Cantharellus anzutake]|uniref:uncharacterized protein n=1 Tax=Cantharellus anzutake TaxID=1750568 RepID=UPI001904EEC3|nr:uncharacterized protein EI90DRAFT_3075845 [Cantharellus anzutake]KAF8324317.1 hypothetical protein EI90DRAFT_3075845 [Cantharellus anzutake]